MAEGYSMLDPCSKYRSCIHCISPPLLLGFLLSGCISPEHSNISSNTPLPRDAEVTADWRTHRKELQELQTKLQKEADGFVVYANPQKPVETAQLPGSSTTSTLAKAQEYRPLLQQVGLEGAAQNGAAFQGAYQPRTLLYTRIATTAGWDVGKGLVWMAQPPKGKIVTNTDALSPTQPRNGETVRDAYVPLGENWYIFISFTPTPQEDPS